MTNPTLASIADQGPDTAAIALRLGVAALLGSLVGWERSRSDKPAATRTMLPVSTGSAAFMLLGLRVLYDLQAVDQAHGVILQADPTRVLSYLISGIGFLGGGAILHSKKVVRGMTTAATIWCTAALGAACGFGEFILAGVLFVIVSGSLWGAWLWAWRTGEYDTNGNGNGDEPDRVRETLGAANAD